MSLWLENSKPPLLFTSLSLAYAQASQSLIVNCSLSAGDQESTRGIFLNALSSTQAFRFHFFCSLSSSNSFPFHSTHNQSRRQDKSKRLLLVSTVGLKVRVGKVSQSTTDEEDGVKTGTQTGGVGTACLGGSGLGGGLGCRVAGLALDGADEEALEDFAGFVAVADVFEGFGGVLAADVEHYFFTTAVRGWLAWCFLCFLCL